jgi:hypothetical protein
MPQFQAGDVSMSHNNLFTRLLHPGQEARARYKKQTAFNRDIQEQSLNNASNSLAQMMQYGSEGFKDGGNTRVSLAEGMITDKSKSVNHPIPATTATGKDVTVHGGGELVVDAKRTSIMENMMATGDMTGLGKYLAQTVNYYKNRDGVGQSSAQKGTHELQDTEGNGVNRRTVSHELKDLEARLRAAKTKQGSSFNIMDDKAEGRNREDVKKLQQQYDDLKGYIQRNGGDKFSDDSHYQNYTKALESVRQARQNPTKPEIPSGSRKPVYPVPDIGYDGPAASTATKKAPASKDTKPATAAKSTPSAGTPFDPKDIAFDPNAIDLNRGADDVIPNAPTPKTAGELGDYDYKAQPEIETTLQADNVEAPGAPKAPTARTAQAPTAQAPQNPKAPEKPEEGDPNAKSLYDRINKTFQRNQRAIATKGIANALWTARQGSKQFDESTVPRRRHDVFIPNLTDTEVMNQQGQDQVTRTTMKGKRELEEAGRTDLLVGNNANELQARNQVKSQVGQLRAQISGQNAQGLAQNINRNADVDFQNDIAREQARGQFNANKEQAIADGIKSGMNVMDSGIANRTGRDNTILSAWGMMSQNKLAENIARYNKGDMKAGEIAKGIYGDIPQVETNGLFDHIQKLSKNFQLTPQ